MLMAALLMAAAIVSVWVNVLWLLATYTLMVAASLLCIQLLILKYPYWVTDVEEAARTSYAATTLAGVD